jgi:hypothetical protein
MKIYHITTDGKATSTGVIMRSMVERYYLDMAPFASCSVIQVFNLIKNLPYRPDPVNVETLMRPKYTMTMRGYGGDCLSEDTKLLTINEFDIVTPVYIANIKVGDIIMGKNGWVKVTKVFDKGFLPTRKYLLSNYGFFIATGEHRCFLANGMEVKAENLEINNHLLKCSHPRFDRVHIVKIVDIVDGGNRHVYDIETEDHGIYLPDADIVVHNCDCKALALASFAYLQKIPYRFIAIRRPGRPVLHHVAVELFMQNQWIFFDPTYNFNSFAQKREEAERVII